MQMIHSIEDGGVKGGWAHPNARAMPPFTPPYAYFKVFLLSVFFVV
jgi:hypothetical protein